jgi:hypothetical protein
MPRVLIGRWRTAKSARAVFWSPPVEAVFAAARADAADDVLRFAGEFGLTSARPTSAG